MQQVTHLQGCIVCLRSGPQLARHGPTASRRRAEVCGQARRGAMAVTHTTICAPLPLPEQQHGGLGGSPMLRGMLVIAPWLHAQLAGLGSAYLAAAALASSYGAPLARERCAALGTLQVSASALGRACTPCLVEQCRHTVFLIVVVAVILVLRTHSGTALPDACPLWCPRRCINASMRPSPSVHDCIWSQPIGVGWATSNHQGKGMDMPPTHTNTQTHRLATEQLSTAHSAHTQREIADNAC